MPRYLTRRNVVTIRPTSVLRNINPLKSTCWSLVNDIRLFFFCHIEWCHGRVILLKTKEVFRVSGRNTKASELPAPIYMRGKGDKVSSLLWIQDKKTRNTPSFGLMTITMSYNPSSLYHGSKFSKLLFRHCIHVEQLWHMTRTWM